MCVCVVSVPARVIYTKTCVRARICARKCRPALFTYGLQFEVQVNFAGGQRVNSDHVRAVDRGAHSAARRGAAQRTEEQTHSSHALQTW